jgi:hypothetical protein
MRKRWFAAAGAVVFVVGAGGVVARGMTQTPAPEQSRLVSFVIDPLSAETTRVVLRLADGSTVTVRARTVVASPTPDGMTLDVYGPGTLEHTNHTMAFNYLGLQVNSQGQWRGEFKFVGSMQR